jgi:hypothetical protein
MPDKATFEFGLHAILDGLAARLFAHPGLPMCRKAGMVRMVTGVVAARYDRAS